MKKHVLKLFLLICLCWISVQSWVCRKESEAVYSRPFTQTLLSFQAETQPDGTSYKIISPSNISLLTLTYIGGQPFGMIIIRNCTFVGDYQSGNLAIQLEAAHPIGVYRLEKSGGETVQCFTVYELGIPRTPTVVSDRNPFVGDSVTLSCISSSTTMYSNHTLSLLYNWTLNGTDITGDTKYTYSLLRRNLTLPTVVKVDAYALFSCSAAENVTGGYTSAKSNTFSITVYYGPDVVVLQPSDRSYRVDENTNVNNIVCSSDCSPACTFSWTKAGQQSLVRNNGLLELGTVQRSYSGVYTCTVRSTALASKYLEAQVDIRVRYGPEESSTRLSPAQTQYIENENGPALRDITCTADCYPACTFNWTKQQMITTKSNQAVLSIGTPTRSDAANYTCTATNPERVSATSMISVNVKVRYGPDSAELTVPRTYTLTEGQPVENITCTSDCYPGCSYRWMNNSVPVGSGDVIQLGTARRYHAGIYTCIARNTATEYDKSSQQYTNVVVQYPPDVKVKASNTSVNASSVVLECNAEGVPSSNYTYGRWIQVWSNNQTVYQWNGSSTLTISNPTYEHSGTYKCSVSNGVRLYSTGQEYMEGSVNLLVQSFPVIIKSTTGAMEILKVPAKLNANASFMIEYYSNVDVTGIECYKLLSRIACKVEQRTKMVDLPVFSNIVRTSGEEANISIEIDSEEKFGPYNITVTNKFSHTMMSVDIKPEGPPSPPKDIIIDRIQQTTVSLSWTPGFNGGFTQSFVIQRQSGTEQWFNSTPIEEPLHETIIKGLKHSTTYFVRMYAFNVKGDSVFTVTYNFTTSFEEEGNHGNPPAALIGGVTGGILAVIVVVVVLIIVLKQRKHLTKGTSRSSNSSDRKTVIKDEPEYGMQDNPMYVSAGPSDNKGSDQETGALYSQVNKKQTTLDNPSNSVYAAVEKKKRKDNKKQGLEIRKKKKTAAENKAEKDYIEGDLYENAPETAVNRGPSHNETIYENPDTCEKKHKKIFNKDGLLYADLEFSDQTKGQKKLVIHGLDDMTVYNQVDFSKKADPLPDSDDEN